MTPHFAPAANRTQFLVRGALVALLLSVTVLQRFGLTAGEVSVSSALFAMYALLGAAVFAGKIALSRGKTLLLAACIAVAITSTLANETRASVSSLLLLSATYLPFAFVLKPNALAQDDAAWVISKFLDIALFCALAGIAQFAAQFAVHSAWLFDFTPYIPAPLRVVGSFNTVISIGSLHKSNGFFFREPSGFSYLVALALVAECVSHKRIQRIACLGLALLLTYSGTGLLALLLATLHPFGVKTLLRLTILACVGALAFWLLGDSLNLSFTLGRINEFSAEHSESSGYIRYIAPGRLVSEMFSSDFWAPWIGHGPGTISRTVRAYQFHDPTWAKLLFEYGALGFVSFVALFLATLWRPFLPLQMRGVLFWGWLVMGGHLLSAEQNFLALALIGILPFGTASTTMRQARARLRRPSRAFQWRPTSA